MSEELSIAILNELKDIRKILIEQSKTLTSQHVILNEHIRRTEILEEQIIPLNKFKAQIEGVLKFIGLLSTLVLILSGAGKLFGWF